MSTLHKLATLLVTASAAAALALGTASCKDSHSYAELLTEENKCTNVFLADQRVVNEIPADTVFECGEDAPYYRLDEDGNIYMQVIDPGTPGENRSNYATSDEVIFFRYTRYNLQNYVDGKLPEGSGNEDDMALGNCWFRFGNYTLESSYQWGTGLQMPLSFLPIDAVVNLVIKSQYGIYSEQSYVTPFLYRVRYYRQQT